jgi:hypothetical protein
MSEEEISWEEMSGVEISGEKIGRGKNVGEELTIYPDTAYFCKRNISK